MERSHAIKSTKQKTEMWIGIVFLSLFAIAMLYPVVYITLGSFKGNQELLSGGARLLPKKFVVSNYAEAWETANFSIYTANSIFLGVGTMILSVIFWRWSRS